jgi:beta-glucosidase
MKFKVSLLYLIIILSGCNAVTSTNPCDIKLNTHDEVTAVAQDPNLVPWWPARHQAVLKRIKKGHVDVIMLGDSITHKWERAGKKVWKEYYGKRNAVNLGFGGDRTQHVLWRIQHGEIEGINPKLAILMIGTNNTGREGSTAERIADGIKAIVCELRKKLPNTKILVLGIFPRGSVEQRKGETYYETAPYNDQWAKIDRINKLTSRIADNKMIYYLNINKVFLNEKGEVTRKALPDLLHPGEKGFQLWAQAMEPTVKKLLSEN